MWDARKFDTPLTRHKMDYPGGPQTVSYDADIRVLYLAGKGTQKMYIFCQLL